MLCSGQQGGDPVRPGVAMTDLATGLYAHGAIMAALLHRHNTGRGVHIDCNLLSSQVCVCVNVYLISTELIKYFPISAKSLFGSTVDKI